MVPLLPGFSMPSGVEKARGDFHYLAGGKRGKTKRRAAAKRARAARKANR